MSHHLTFFAVVVFKMFSVLDEVQGPSFEILLNDINGVKLFLAEPGVSEYVLLCLTIFVNRESGAIYVISIGRVRVGARPGSPGSAE